MILDRYIARRFTLIFAGVLVLFVIISGFIGLVDQLRRFSGADASFGEILRLSLLDVPQSLYAIMPLIMIISAITLFLGLARSSEMVVTRAAGRSALRALLPVVTMALIIGAITVAAMNPIVAATSRQYDIAAGALEGESPILALGESGLWLRQGDADGQTVIHAERANLTGTALRDVTFTTFTALGSPVSRTDAARATLREGAWLLTDTKTWPLDPFRVAEAEAVMAESLTISSTLTADQIRNSFGTPSTISIWDLPAFIDRLQSAGFSAQRHLMWFHMEIATPVFLVAMVMMGAAFTVRHQRGGRTGVAVLSAILFSFGFYFVRNFAQILGENGDVPTLLAAWAPPLAAIGVAWALLLHREDG